MQTLKLYYPLYQQRTYRYRRMPVVWIKPVGRWRKRIGMIAAISLAGLLSGCAHTSSSVVPQDGPTMQAIYTQASRSSTKRDKPPTSWTRKPVAQTLPEMAPLVVFAHPVQVGRDKIVIPTYCVQFRGK